MTEPVAGRRGASRPPGAGPFPSAGTEAPGPVGVPPGERTETDAAPPPRPRRVVVALLAILLLGACLRAPITSVGPLLDRIGTDTGLGNGLLGLFAAMPLLGFALVSPIVHAPARRVGLERMVAAALVVLTLGIVLRSVPIAGGLWLGTILVGGGIAVGNVLAPALVKRDQPGRIALVTACFTATMGACAALGSGLSVPLSDATGGGWRLALAAWAVPVAVVAVLWSVRAAVARPAEARKAPAADRGRTGEARGRSMWRSAAAWQVTVFMGVQSTTFYVMANWLPSILIGAGFAPARAGWLLFAYHLMGIASALGVTRLMRGRSDLRAVVVLISAFIVVGAIGLLTASSLALLWVLCVATGSGASLVVALSLFGLRTRHAAQAAQLSGMAQSVGYLIAAAGPVLAGAVRDWTGSWTPVLGLVLCFGAGQGLIGLWAGRPGYVRD